MQQCEDLTVGQKKLYDNLMIEIEKGGDNSIFPILKEASKKDFLAVFNTTSIINFQGGGEFALTMLSYCAISLDPEKITKVILDVAKKDKEVLKEVLTTPNIEIKLPNGEERTLTPLGYAIYFKNSEKEIKAILDIAKENDMLEKVLTTPNIEIKFSDENKYTLTPLGYAIYLNNSEKYIKAILAVAKENDMLEKVLTTPNIEIKLSNGEECTLTPLGYAIYLNNSEKYIKAILAVAKENDMLEKVLTTPNIEIKLPNGEERTLTPLGYAIDTKNQEGIRAILDIAEKNNILKEVFVGIEEHDHKRLNKLTENSLNNGSETTTTDQQRALNPELVANEPKAVGELKFIDEKLLLVTTSDQFAKCKDYRNTQSANPDELLMFIKCGANEYRIVGNSTERSILIKSILRKSEGDKYIDGNILRVEEEIRSVKKMLGLKNGVTEVKVESISNELFGVKTPTSTAQQTINNTTIDQPTSLAVTNEHKETLVNAHEEKDEHNNAASNRKVQPVEVDKEVKILMGDLLSEVSAQDSDKVEKTPISKRSERESFPSGPGEEEFYDTEDKPLSSITSDDDTLEFQDAIDDGITQPRLINFDMVVEKVETKHHRQC